MDLSVIIVNYNVRHFLEQCLTSVRKSAENIDAEVFVVDNNSADDSCSMVTVNFPEVILIRNGGNKGFSAACNQAIRVSAGRFILLLNPDTIVEEDTFSRCLAFMNQNPEAGALGVKMINGNGRFLPESKRSLPTPSTAFFKMIGFSRLFPGSKFFNRYYLGHLDSSETSESDILSGAFMFIRRDAVEKTGLLDETYFMYGEDIDLSYRLIKAGYKNYYYPVAKIIHFKGESTRKGDINHIVHFYKAMLIFIRSHFGRKGNGALLLLIRTTIYFWGSIALVKDFFHRHMLRQHARRTSSNPSAKARRVVIVCHPATYGNIIKLLGISANEPEKSDRVSILSDDPGPDLIGNMSNLREIIQINRIGEVIYSVRDLTVSQLIESMESLADSNVTIRMSPSGEKFIIGSKYVKE